MLDLTMTLVQLAFVATVLTVALEQIFDTNLYQKYLGKGLDGQDTKDSRFFKSFELRPWLSTAVGIFLAFSFGMTAIESGLGSEFMTPPGDTGAEAKMVDMVLTGLIIGGGTKTIKKIAKRFRETTQEAVQQGTGSAQ